MGYVLKRVISSKGKSIYFLLFLVFVFLLVNIIAFNQAKGMAYYQINAKKTNLNELNFLEKIRVILFGKTIPRPKVIETPADYGLEYSEHRLASTDDVDISLWCISKDKSSKAIILCPGYSRCKSDLLLEAKYFWQQGFTCFIFDFRGTGDSNKSYTTAGYKEAEDFVCVYRFIIKNFSFDHISLFGHSMGAIAIFKGIHTYKLQVDKIIIEAIYASLIETIKSRLKLMKLPHFPLAYLIIFWGGIQHRLYGFNMNIRKYAQSIDVPILMLHGEKDAKAELDGAVDVFNHIKTNNKKLVVMPNLIHESYIDKLESKWTSEVGIFLKD